MVLLVGGVALEEPLPDMRTLIHTYPMFRESAAQLLAIQPKVIGPVGLLYVQQREIAITIAHDKNVNILGTDDATSCIIVIFRHTGSGAVGLGHFDGAGIEEGVSNIVNRVQELTLGYQEGRFELHLIGGYPDPRNCAEELFYNLIRAFNKQLVEIDLVMACIGELNTTVRSGGLHWPLIYGAGVNVKTGEIFPANFPDKGPEQSLRGARHFTGGQQMLDIYDCNLGLLRIGPFNYDPVRGIDLWLEQPDEFILQHLSSTPEVEPPHFVMQIRACLKYIQDHPFPAITVFRDNRPHYFRRDENGLWTPFRY